MKLWNFLVLISLAIGGVGLALLDVIYNLGWDSASFGEDLGQLCTH